MTPTSIPPALQAVDLFKSYPGGRGKPPVVALDGLGFEVARGQVFGLLGPNGAGKSTTVKVLSTLTRADRGTAVVAGIDVTADPVAVRRRIGLVSQRPSSDPIATGRENLVLAARIQGLSKAEAGERTDWLLDRFGLAEAADRLVRTWSGGMSRKLDVAIGLVHRPEVLFLDEPTTGLDPEARAELWAEIGRLAGDDAMTVLLAHRLAIVDHGRVAVEGTPEALKSELHGDTVVVEVVTPADAIGATDALAGVAGVTEVVAEGTTLRARADLGARAVPAVFAALDGRGIEVVSATVARPSLDDVYLRYVGRSFEPALLQAEVA
jgi:ABC-2 type transport system ATP-binding protein